MKTQAKLSKPSKMPCPTFALQALDTCPGAYDDKGNIKQVCSKCYAMKGSYVWKDTKRVREDNLVASKQHDFVEDMIRMINKIKGRHFRWFDSGDIYSREFLAKIVDICFNTPLVKHWIPTKSRELFNQTTWEALESLPNVRVRYSSPSITGQFDDEHGSTVVPDKNYFSDDNPASVFNCRVTDKKCGPCRACWSKNIKVIAYLQH